MVILIIDFIISINKQMWPAKTAGSLHSPYVGKKKKDSFFFFVGKHSDNRKPYGITKQIQRPVAYTGKKYLQYLQNLTLPFQELLTCIF